jgi:hypothetical protein
MSQLSTAKSSLTVEVLLDTVVSTIDVETVMIKGFVKRLVVLLGAQATIFGVITGYDQLMDGAARTWLIDQGWSIPIAIALYWVGPIILYISAETIRMVTAWGLRFLTGWFLEWKLERAIHLNITAEEILSAINRAESRGLLNKDEASMLERVTRDLEPIEFEILVLFDDPTDWAGKLDARYPQLTSARYSQLLEFAFPPFKGQKNRYGYYIKRLHTKRLLLLGPDDMNTVLSENELLRPRTTPAGHKLACLIKDVRGL